jgi:DNA-binding NarL/FixJ family response regulator
MHADRPPADTSSATTTQALAEVLIVDDHAILREGLAMLLAANIADLHIAAVGSLEAALAHTGTPVVILLDIRLPGIDGLTGLPLLLQRWPQARAVVLSSMDDAATRQLALSRGASTFITKSDAGNALVQAVAALLDLPGLASKHRAGLVSAPIPASIPDLMPGRRSELLTPRRQEVLELLGHGLSNKRIATSLALSENTVRRHLQDIFADLNVANRTEAVVEARRRGLIR